MCFSRCVRSATTTWFRFWEPASSTGGTRGEAGLGKEEEVAEEEEEEEAGRRTERVAGENLEEEEGSAAAAYTWLLPSAGGEGWTTCSPTKTTGW